MTCPTKPKAPTIFGRRMGRGSDVDYEHWTFKLGERILEVERDGTMFVGVVDGLMVGPKRTDPQGAALDVERCFTKLRDQLCKLTGTVAVDTVMPDVPDMCPTDSKELSKLRAAIDDAGLFPSEAASERGDYVAAVRSAGRRLKARAKPAPKKRGARG